MFKCKTINCDIHPNNEINSTPNEINSNSSGSAQELCTHRAYIRLLSRVVFSISKAAVQSVGLTSVIYERREVHHTQKAVIG